MIIEIGRVAPQIPGKRLGVARGQGCSAAVQLALKYRYGMSFKTVRPVRSAP